VFHELGATAVATADRTLISNLVGIDETGKYVIWLSLASAFSGMYYMVTLYTQFSGKTERLAAVTLTVGILDVFLCYALIRLNGGVGAAQATAISQLLAFIATWVIAARLIDMDWLFRKHEVQMR
jgi:Na+-driven multidrug efflux pump